MKDVCVYDDTYDIIMDSDLYSSSSSAIKDSFANRLYCLIEEHSRVLALNDYLRKFHNNEEK